MFVFKHNYVYALTAPIEFQKSYIDVYRLYKLFRDKEIEPLNLLKKYCNNTEKINFLEQFNIYQSLYSDKQIETLFPKVYDKYYSLMSVLCQTIYKDLNLSEIEYESYCNVFLPLMEIYKQIYYNTNCEILYDVNFTTNGKIKIHPASLINPLKLGGNKFNEYVKQNFSSDQIISFDFVAFEPSVIFNLLKIEFDSDLYEFLAKKNGVSRSKIKASIFKWLWSKETINYFSDYQKILDSYRADFQTMLDFQYHVAEKGANYLREFIVKLNKNISTSHKLLGIIYDSYIFKTNNKQNLIQAVNETVQDFKIKLKFTI